MKIFLQNNQLVKQCPKCNQIKILTYFYKSNSIKSGYNCYCIECNRQIGKNYNLKNKDKISIKAKQWYKNNKEKRRKQIYEYRKQNKDKVKKFGREWAKNRRKTHLQYKLKSNLSRRMREMISENSKGGRTLELLGCTIEEFKKYIENLWLNGMSWDNYGNKNGNWNFDHKICCELFNLSDPNQQKVCFHYSNIQPLWCLDNTKKNDVIYKGKQARFLSKEEKLEYLKTLGYHF